MTYLLTSPSGDPARPMSAVLTRVTFALYLDRSLSAFDRDAAAGRIPAPCFHLRRSPRWRREIVDRWIDAGAPSREEWEAMNGRRA